MSSRLVELLNTMLDGFDATYGPQTARSVMIPATAREPLARSKSFSTREAHDRAITPAGWYRGAPVDVVSHDRDWLIAVIATNPTAELYGDIRTGNITTTFPARH